LGKWFPTHASWDESGNTSSHYPIVTQQQNTMKTDDQPEDVLLDHELNKYQDLLNKLFGGQMPTEKEAKQVLNFLSKSTEN